MKLAGAIWIWSHRKQPEATTRWCSIMASLAVVLGTVAAQAQTNVTGQCPMIATAGGVKMEIASIFYPKRVEGVDGNVIEHKGEDAKKFRLALVTIKVEKPAGQQLEVAAADLSLHYSREDGSAEVAPCEGLSSFNQSPEEDRPMKLPRTSGPGFTKQRTGVRASQATVVYLDAVFGWIEPHIREVWLCVGRPVKAEPLHTTGWKTDAE